jgi:hypothetical protein
VNLNKQFKTFHIKEPNLVFGNNQATSDPRDGLILFGPYEKFNKGSVLAGVIGTKQGLILYKKFVSIINEPLISTKWNYQSKSHESDELQRPSFPGFEAVFNIHWNSEPELQIEINENEILKIIQGEKNKKKRTNALVDLYLSKLIESKNKEDVQINLWFVIVPKKLYEECRPNSHGTELSKNTIKFLKDRELGQGSLFDDGDYIEEIQRIVNTSSDFHHLLKARLIQEEIEAPIQIFVEPKLQFRDILHNIPYDPNIRAHFAWTISTTVYYKLGKLPWKLSGIRDGVCYLGLVFKKLNEKEGSSVCSAAQMFLKDGDGAVFRGNIGLWASAGKNEYHLDRKASFELLSMALLDYKDKWNTFPLELFIHGRVEFGKEEWNGFLDALEFHHAATELIGVVIKDKAPLKLFREAPNQENKYGVLRGIGICINETEGYLNTRGFVPRLNTSLSMEIPNTLFIKVIQGKKDLETVMTDILALTKLNYNACVYGDGKPVTLSFSDSIGSILTATDQWKVETRQFKYYI